MTSFLDYPPLAADYASYHTTRGNQLCHSLGVPLIAYAVVAWSRAGTPFPFAALLLPLYFRWNARVGMLMTLFVAASALLAARLPGWASWTAFLIGFVFQYVGHAVYEKKSPAFFKNLLHLLVGPAWVAAKLARLKAA